MRCAMGTAPVEADGSFFVKAPADRAIRFVLLDAKGSVLRQEHGWFWITARGAEDLRRMPCGAGACGGESRACGSAAYHDARWI